MRGILIDPSLKSVREVSFTENLQSIYDLLGCEVFDMVSIDNEHDMFIDDEGLFRDEQKFFSLYGAHFAGKALVCASNAEGETIGIDTPVETIAKKVTFLEEYEPEEPTIFVIGWD